MGKTLVDKIWDKHLVKKAGDNMDILFVSRHFIHEVTSPQAFNGLRERGVKVFMPHRVTATADHNVPTVNQHLPIRDNLSRTQVDTLQRNCKEHDIEYFGIGHQRQGIVHVIGPEQGLTRPGMVIVCGDSHTSTHGAFGTLAFGIGTSQVEQVFASQCLVLSRPKTMRITVNGRLKKGVTSKDVILYIIAQLGTQGATGHFVEYAGSTFRSMSMEERMTVCNMSIEMGARGGLVGIDDNTINYVLQRSVDLVGEKRDKAVAHWLSLNTDEDASFDQEVVYSAEDIGTMVTCGTSPDTAIEISSVIGTNRHLSDKALEYMKFNREDKLEGQKLDYVFIGSCTNSRIEDLRAAAEIIKDKTKAAHIKAWVVPGSQEVMKQAQKEGLDKIFLAAGFEFREPGCSACLAMNDDKIPSGALCISTSNRNFEGRQGEGARTILASPVTAGISAITGLVTNPLTYLN